ncbi:ribonuclease H-like domain-containing protein [Tanacetum coccineum]
MVKFRHRRGILASRGRGWDRALSPDPWSSIMTLYGDDAPPSMSTCGGCRDPCIYLRCFSAAWNAHIDGVSLVLSIRSPRVALLELRSGGWPGNLYLLCGVLSFGVIVQWGVYLSFSRPPSDAVACACGLPLALFHPGKLDRVLGILLSFEVQNLAESPSQPFKPSMLLRGVCETSRAFPTNVELNMWHHTVSVSASTLSEVSLRDELTLSAALAPTVLGVRTWRTCHSGVPLSKPVWTSRLPSLSTDADGHDIILMSVQVLQVSRLCTQNFLSDSTKYWRGPSSRSLRYEITGASSVAPPSLCEGCQTLLGPLFRRGGGGGLVVFVPGTVWGGVVKVARCSPFVLVIVVVVWVVPRGGPIVVKTRSCGALALPDACLEICLEAWSLCFFARGVRWVKFPCFVILDFGSVLSVGSHGWRQSVDTKVGDHCISLRHGPGLSTILWVGFFGILAKITHIGNLKLNNDVILFDVLVIPEYCVSLLSVHKLIKDSKLIVSFDETKCVIQDLKREKVLGTGSESAGLYVFDANCDKLVVSNQSKFLVCYVSKEVWHNRLGHPANSLNLSNLDHNSPCEVCHKAKQTRDSFPISDHKSVALGDLIHLDVWGPYKVVSRDGFRLPSSVLNGKSPFSLVYGREPNLSHLRSFGCLCFATVVKGFDKFSEKAEKCVLIAKTFSSPNDDEEGPSGRDGNVHQPVPDSQNQPRHGDQHFATPIDDENLSEGNGGSHLELNEFVLDGKVKYGLHRYANHTLLRGENYCFVTNLNKSIEPSSFEEASKDINWINAMNEELHALYENNTWELCDLPAGRKPIGSKWVYRIKYMSSGEIERFKARLVAKGFGQKEGIDYEETFSPVEVYMLPPPGFSKPNENKVCKLKKSLYGLKQAPRKWNHKLTEALRDAGFVQSKNDHSLFVKNVGSVFLYVLVYVDDLVITGNDELEIENFKRKYCLEFLHDFGLLGCKPVMTPLPENIVLAHKESEIDKFLVNFANYQRLSVLLPEDQFLVNVFLSIASVTCEIMWIVKIMKDLNVDNLIPANLYCDNKSAIQITANPVMHEKTKHFDLDVHLVREKVSSGLIKTVKVDSRENVVDVLTKSLGSYQHTYLVKKFGILNMFGL